MSRPRFVSTTIRYAVVYVLIQTFMYQVAKDGLRYSSPFVLMGIRLLIASLLTFGVARRFRPIVNKDMILLSFFTCLATGLWAYGLEYVSPADSAVLSYAMPLFSIPMAAVILSEKPTGSEWGGAVVGFLGVLIYSLSFTSHSFTLFGGMLTLVNAFFYAMFTVYFRKLKNQDPAITVATQLLFVALVALVLAPLDYKLVINSNFLFDLAYLSILAGPVFFYLWNALARLQKIGKTTAFVYLTPVAATVVQSVQTSLAPDIVSLSGLAMMLLGISISNGTIPLQKNANRASCWDV